MKQIAVVLVLCLLLTGCGSWMDGEYAYVTPHKMKEQPQEQDIPTVSTYNQLRDALSEVVENGTQEALLSVEDYKPTMLEDGIERAVTYILTRHPIGAYAVEDITCELGTSGGIKALAVTVTYSRNPDEIRNIRTAETMEQAEELIAQSLGQCEAGVVLRIGAYEETDFSQIVENYGEMNPDVVMEVPQVTASVYPEKGSDRVVDIRFSYQTNRDSLKQMQKYVQPIFSSAVLYVSSEEESESVRYARLYTFLMERNDYRVETSITPTYSLLRHGVGDNKAFALVYSAMCRKAGLECLVVSGTYQGEARFWNIICDNGIYYHVDILSPNGFIKYSDKQMAGYVWDYSAYPACGVTQQAEQTEE